MLNLNGSGAEPLEDDDPRRIGPIPLAGRLGSGGMGRVFLGVYEGRYAAVKQLLPSVVGEDPAFLRRFGHELDNLSRLPERATAPLLASDRTARPPWFATAYVPGLTLREAVEVHGGPLPPEALWLLLREAAAGLAAVHALEMVHRDVKPSNVMLTLDGLTLIDFGVARAAEQSQLTRTGMVVGTPAYMSPEQPSGARRLTPAVDVFALGSVLAYAACGRPPFGDESGHGVLYRIVHEEPDLGPLRDRCPGLVETVEACLDKDPEGRPTAAELVELAERHGPFTEPLWPEAVTERLAERTAFSETIPAIPTIPESVPDTVPDPEAEPKPSSSRPEPSESPERPERPDRRRTRVLFAVVPVVVVVTGTTLAIQLLPNTSPPPDGAHAKPSASVPASLTPTPSSSPSSDPRPSNTARPSNSPPPATSQAADSGAREEGVQDDSGDAAAGSGSDGNDRSAGSGTSGRDTDGATDSGAGAAAPTGYFQLKNAYNGRCLDGSQGTYGVRFGGCSDSPAMSWAYKNGSGGAYQLVNEYSGQCLTASVGNVTSTGTCDGSAQQSWRTGSGGTLQSTYNSLCLDESAGWPSAATCESGKVSQRWTKL
ncbi:protein kinase [Streptomyces sp. NPDC059866]|uniref:protein kinase domain-containing protein n=1 Tax=Streptomyces sp. NPDC059866 TaxID=3346978 RepID=UPI0036687975